jgi:hypothetical protein
MNAERLEIATRIMQGFCANPCVFAYNSQFGWGLVNMTYAELSNECLRLADELLAQSGN